MAEPRQLSSSKLIYIEVSLDFKNQVFPCSSRQIIIADTTRVLKRVRVMMILSSKEIILEVQHEDFESFYLRDITHISIKENTA